LGTLHCRRRIETTPRAEVLEEYASRDARVKLFFRTENGHVSATSNRCPRARSGTFVAYSITMMFSRGRSLWKRDARQPSAADVDVIYSDEDRSMPRAPRAPTLNPMGAGTHFYRELRFSSGRVPAQSNTGSWRLSAWLRRSQDYDLLCASRNERIVSLTSRVLYHGGSIQVRQLRFRDQKGYALKRPGLALGRSDRTAR